MRKLVLGTVIVTILLTTGLTVFHTESSGEGTRNWRKKLTPLQYHVTRRKGTERAFSGKYWNNRRPGTYVCVCCDSPLFGSDAKFNSGTGWPSFFQPITDNSVRTRRDFSGFMIRTEVICPQCEAHLGHVFRDGPRPTGLRYCINSAALDFHESHEVSPSRSDDD